MSSQGAAFASASFPRMYVKYYRAFQEFEGKRCLGVSAPIMHKYMRGEQALLGKICLVAGKERLHNVQSFDNAFNLFGGKVERTPVELTTKANMMLALETLYDEVYEEFGVSLTPELFERALIDTECISYGSGFTAIFYLHITGISRKWWSDLHGLYTDDGNMIVKKGKRLTLNPNLPWPYVEMSCIEHLPVNALEDATVKISPLIKDMIPSLERVSKMLDETHSERIALRMYVNLQEFEEALLVNSC